MKDREVVSEAPPKWLLVLLGCWFAVWGVLVGLVNVLACVFRSVLGFVQGGGGCSLVCVFCVVFLCFVVGGFACWLAGWLARWHLRLRK